MGKKGKKQKSAFLFKLDSFETYLEECERSRSTINKYMHDVQVFAAYAGMYDELDKSVVLQYKEWLWQHYSVSSCNSMLSSLNRYLRYLEMENLIVKGFRSQKKMMLTSDSLLTIEEFRKLLKAARKVGNERLYVCMQTIFMTGARVSELSYFTVESVRAGRVTVRNKGKVRVILIPDVLRTLLVRYAESEGIREGAVFVTRHGKPVNRSNLWKEMQQLKDWVDVSPSKMHPHNIRHLFARTFYQETSDVVGLSDILGHSSLNVTRIYTSGTEDAYLADLNRMTKKIMAPD